MGRQSGQRDSSTIACAAFPRDRAGAGVFNTNVPFHRTIVGRPDFKDGGTEWTPLTDCHMVSQHLCLNRLDRGFADYQKDAFPVRRRPCQSVCILSGECCPNMGAVLSNIDYERKAWLFDRGIHYCSRTLPPKVKLLICSDLSTESTQQSLSPTHIDRPTLTIDKQKQTWDSMHSCTLREAYIN